MTRKAERLYKRGVRLYYAMGEMLGADLAVRDLAVSSKDIVKQARKQVIEDYDKVEEELKRVDPETYKLFQAEIGLMNSKSRGIGWGAFNVIEMEKRYDDLSHQIRVKDAGMDLSSRAIASGLWDDGLRDCRKYSNRGDWILPAKVVIAMESMPAAWRVQVLFELKARSMEIHNAQSVETGKSSPSPD